MKVKLAEDIFCLTGGKANEWRYKQREVTQHFSKSIEKYWEKINIGKNCQLRKAYMTQLIEKVFSIHPLTTDNAIHRDSLTLKKFSKVLSLLADG